MDRLLYLISSQSTIPTSRNPRAIDLHDVPEKITIDKSGTNTAAIVSIQADRDHCRRRSHVQPSGVDRSKVVAPCLRPARPARLQRPLPKPCRQAVPATAAPMVRRPDAAARQTQQHSPCRLWPMPCTKSTPRSWRCGADSSACVAGDYAMRVGAGQGPRLPRLHLRLAQASCGLPRLQQVGPCGRLRLGDEGRGVLLRQEVQRGLFRAATLVDRSAIRRTRGLPADGLHARLPRL